MKSSKKHSVTSRIIFNYLINHKFKILLALIMMIISAAATGLHAWLVRPALDEVLIKGNKEMLFLIPIAIIIVTLIKGLAKVTVEELLTVLANGGTKNNLLSFALFKSVSLDNLFVLSFTFTI